MAALASWQRREILEHCVTKFKARKMIGRSIRVFQQTTRRLQLLNTLRYGTPAQAGHRSSLYRRGRKWSSTHTQRHDLSLLAWQERYEELARALCIEAGKPIKDSRGEVGRLIDTFMIAMEECTRNYGASVLRGVPRCHMRHQTNLLIPSDVAWCQSARLARTHAWHLLMFMASWSRHSSS